MTINKSTSKKSISQKLNRCFSRERQLELTNNWLDNWAIEQKYLLKKLEIPCQKDEIAYQALCALHAINNKKIIALKNILKILQKNIDTHTAE